ncbi:uncharacterized protein LOC131665509 [Phymastichus coffea]|uniref:uncharacterized protein LOC131665509 n=1 Tax=Phymastichus coffea TaxID=108790 RepID=UPI00273BA85E|nr:uncharacterized protein LOC131665509 [Phymastichus coffea]
MQREQSKITALRKNERKRGARTPDRVDVRNVDISTMSLSSPKRSVHTSRMSMMPSSGNSSVNLRKIELENNNLELELIYSEYVSSYAELFLEQKSLKEDEDSFEISLKKAHKETKSLLENKKSIETRINDIKALTCINDYLDSVQSTFNDCKEKEQKHKTLDILKHLRELLDRFSILRCENIILPSGPEELKQFKKTLNNCSDLLTEINRFFNSNEMETIAAYYREFLLMCKEISSIKKMVEEKIYDLQIENLKSCANLLSQNEENFLN